MKLRFCHKIQYSIEVEEELQTQMVPKIVFQPVVENSIKHGFNRHEDVMEIRIRGRIDREKNQWEMLFEDNGGWYVDDLNSLNGTSVNGRKIVPGQPVRLKSGDEISLSDETFLVQE